MFSLSITNPNGRPMLPFDWLIHSSLILASCHRILFFVSVFCGWEINLKTKICKKIQTDCEGNILYLYADDTTIWETNSDPLLIQRGLQDSLDRTSRWLSLNKMVPNTKKTKYLIIGTVQKLLHSGNPSIWSISLWHSDWRSQGWKAFRR